MSVVKKPFCLFLISILYLLCVIDMGSSESKQSTKSNKLSIKLKARTIVLGPNVTLGNVSHIVTPNNNIRAKLLVIKIGHAPPPGESNEIKVSHIKRCLKVAGFGEYINTIIGPRTIRVVTAEIEIDKAILKEEFAKLITNTALLFTFET